MRSLDPGMVNLMTASSYLDHGGCCEDDREKSIPAGLKRSRLYLSHPDPITWNVVVWLDWILRGCSGGRDQLVGLLLCEMEGLKGLTSASFSFPNLGRRSGGLPNIIS